MIQFGGTRLAEDPRLPTCLLRSGRACAGPQELPQVRLAESEAEFSESQILGGHLGSIGSGNDTLARECESMLHFCQLAAERAFESEMIASCLGKGSPRAGDFGIGIAAAPDRDAHSRDDPMVKAGSLELAFVLCAQRDDRIPPLVAGEPIEIGLGTRSLLTASRSLG